MGRVLRIRNLPEQAVKKHNVGVAFTDGGKNELIVRRPGNMASDERPAVPEIGDGVHGSACGGQKPKIRTKGVVQRERQPLAVRRKDGVKTLPSGNAMARNGRE